MALPRHNSPALADLSFAKEQGGSQQLVCSAVLPLVKFPFPPAPLAIQETSCLPGGSVAWCGGFGRGRRVLGAEFSCFASHPGERSLAQECSMPVPIAQLFWSTGLVERNSLADILWDGTGLQSRETCLPLPPPPRGCLSAAHSPTDLQVFCPSR